jgi:4-alpha-glucanotransferase
MPVPRRSGVLLHPTSLPGPYGLGELGPHAVRWLDWLAESGQRVWQVLPLGPTGYGDSPYQSFSSFAGNPYLISLERLHEEGWLKAEDLVGGDFGDGRVDFGAGHRVPPAGAAPRRRGLALVGRRERARQFAAFRERAGAWLDDFALFMASRRRTGAVRGSSGTPRCASGKPRRWRAREAHAEAIERHMLWQWWFDRQWGDVRAAAAERGIVILGDVPIFVAFDSADTWADQDLFHLDDEGQPDRHRRGAARLLLRDRSALGQPALPLEPPREARLRLVDRPRAAHAGARRRAAHRPLPRLRGLLGDPGRGAHRGEGPLGQGSRPAAVRRVRGALAGEGGDLPIVAEDLGVITPASRSCATTTRCRA